MKILIDVRGLIVLSMDDFDLISRIRTVSRDGYGKEATYLPSDDTIDIAIIQDHQLITSKEQTEAELRKLLTSKEQTEAELRKLLKKAEDEKSAQWLKMYNAEQGASKLKKEIETLRSVCPHEPEDKGEL